MEEFKAFAPAKQDVIINLIYEIPDKSKHQPSCHLALFFSTITHVNFNHLF